MKYIKTYEQININEPKIGDYVICDESHYASSSPQMKYFVLNNIGQIIRMIDQILYPYVIIYENQALPNGRNTREMSLKEIIYWSPNKEDLEIYIDANKYNL